MNVDFLLDAIKPKIFKGHNLEKELIFSLTSYPKRFGVLRYVLISLLNQTISPDRIILWIYKKDFEELPVSVTELERQGIFIFLLEEDWKSYKKIIPAIELYPDAIIITFDDDILYKPTVAEELVEYHRINGGIVAQRAHLLQVNQNGEIMPYKTWLEKTPAKGGYEANSAFVFPTSGAGVLYPPGCFDPRVLDMDLAFRICPTADDVWLYFMALLKGSKASLIGDRDFIDINPAPEDSLWAINSKGENDRQIANLIEAFGIPDVLRSSIERAIQGSTSSDVVKLFNGKIIHVLDDHIGRIISASKMYYESDLISFVRRFFSPSRVIDVGTNIGNHALGFSGHSDYHVICFEPDPTLAKIAEKNLKLNEIKYDLYNFGLGDKNEKIPFIAGESSNSGVGRFDRNAKSTLYLQVMRLDDAVPSSYSADLIKIDVEGFEKNVLLGGLDTIQNSRPVLVIEHQDYISFKECSGLLHKLGYKPLRVFGATPTFVYVFADDFGYVLTSTDITWVDCWGEFAK